MIWFFGIGQAVCVRFNTGFFIAAGSITECMAGRPTFKNRKIVIEPAVCNFLSISIVIDATSMTMKNLT